MQNDFKVVRKWTLKYDSHLEDPASPTGSIGRIKEKDYV